VRRDELSEAERQVWDACAQGAWADVRSGAVADPPVADPPHTDPPHTDPPADGRPAEAVSVTVRAVVLAALLQQEPERVDGRMPALRLRGARITGRLELSFSRVVLPVQLEACSFDEAPDLTGADTRTIELRDCRLPGLGARLLRVDGDLRLNACTVDGCLMVENADIAGAFSIGGSLLSNPGGRALSGGGMAIGGGFFARRGVRTEGSVRIIGARVAGGIFFEGARLHQPGGVGLCADEVVTTRILCSDGFCCDGELQVRGAQVSGEVNLFGASLRADRKAVRARGLTAGELILAPAQAQGMVDLSRVRVGAIRDNRGSWPQQLRLDGLTYEQLLPLGERLDVRARCEWLARDVEEYRPQPYEQLADHYRRLGHDDDARTVLLAKQRRRRQTLHPLARLGGYLLDGLVGYGYRPWLAAGWLVVLLTAGTAVFGARPPVALDPSHQPHFDALIYTLDLLVPIGAFGLRTTFVPVGGTRWMAYALIATGWILATALIAGVTRSLRRD
jgi:hypothetical protein